MGIEDAIMSLMGVMTPTFYINDEHAANNLGDFLKDNKLEDCFCNERQSRACSDCS